MLFHVPKDEHKNSKIIKNDAKM